MTILLGSSLYVTIPSASSFFTIVNIDDILLSLLSSISTLNFMPSSAAKTFEGLIWKL